MKNLIFLFFLAGILLLPGIIYSNQQYIYKIAIIDTGLDMKDPRFKNVLCKEHANFTNEKDIDIQGHGSHVAGLIKEHAKDAHYCLMIIKALGKDQRELPVDEAILFAAKNRANVVNMSIQGDTPNAMERQLMANFSSITFVVAAGNGDKDLDKTPSYPASYNLDNEIVVGNADDSGVPCRGSNYGSIVKVWKNGCNVLSTLPNNRVGYMGGSSMSAAIESGDYVYQLSKNN